MLNIVGKASHQNLGTGFWGITDAKGKQWRPENMPEQLKYEGATVRCKVKVVEDEASIFMWGTPVLIVSFQTIGIVS